MDPREENNFMAAEAHGLDLGFEGEGQGVVA
jgi:hypothetical protein